LLVDTEFTSDVVLEDLADRIGRFATEDMIVALLGSKRTWEWQMESGRRNFAIAGSNAAYVTLDIARDFFDAEEFVVLVDQLRTWFARHEEMAA
jgi:hypothetical protein